MTDRHPDRSPALTGLEPLVRLILAALGALTAHQIAYPLVGAVGLDISANGDHGHIGLQWALITPLAIIGAVAVLVRQIRRLGFTKVASLGRLSALVAAFFVVQEGIESLLAGGSGFDIVTNPAVLLGLVLTPVVAWLLIRLLDEVAELVTRWLAPSATPPSSGPGLIPLPVRWSDSGRGTSSRPRAPPRRRR